MVDQIVFLMFLLIFSAFFSAAETALFSISKTKARYLSKQEGQANKLIRKMKKEPHKLLSTILIGNNVVNVASSSIATAIAIKIFSNKGIGIATGCMTFLILIFGEIFPKSIATHYNITVARLVIIPIYWLSIFFSPIIKFLDFIPKLIGQIEHKPTITEEELMTIVELGEEEGEIKEEEKRFIYNIFEFDDTSASEIMTPRADMFVLDCNQKLPLNDVIKSGFSRIPVIEDNIDNVIGIIHIKDLFKHQSLYNDKELNIKKIMRKPYFIPESKKLNSLFHEFKNGKHHIALVVDEHGGISGLITLEDVIEEIVGDITDETDKAEPHIIKMKNKEWIVLGKSDIDEVNEKLKLNLPESKDYDTFSGYILNTIGRIPKETEQIAMDNFIVTVKEVVGNRVKSFLIQKKIRPS